MYVFRKFVLPTYRRCKNSNTLAFVKSPRSHIILSYNAIICLQLFLYSYKKMLCLPRGALIKIFHNITRCLLRKKVTLKQSENVYISYKHSVTYSYVCCILFGCSLYFTNTLHIFRRLHTLSKHKIVTHLQA